jgi:hypothetical protein
MQDPSTPGSGTAGRAGRRLLLLLAVAACGRGSGDQADPPPRPGGPEKVVMDSSARAAPACEGPSPVVDTTLLRKGAEWEPLGRWLADSTRFKDSSSDSAVNPVRLCDTCAPVRMRIVAETRTYCNTPESLDRTTRTAGVWVVLDGTVTPPGWGATFARDDSIFVFAHDTASSAILAYRVGPKRDRVGVAPDSAWSFRYCRDGHTGEPSLAKWRVSPSTRANAARAGAARDTTPPPNDPGTYGWMSCASGCCQFYIPPGPVGGGGGGGPPPRCPGGR